MSEARRDAQPVAASAEEDPNATVVCSSPPCFMHELDPSYLGYLGKDEVSALLDGLLAAEWGGAVPEEARLRAALRRHVEAPSDRSDRAPVPGGEPDRPARAIREALPRIYGDALRRDLVEVLAALERGDGSSPDGGPGER